MGRYVQIEEITNWPVTLTTDEREARISLAEQLVERVCRDIFVPTPFLIELDGSGLQEQFLPFRYKLVKVNYILFSGQTFTGDYLLTDRSIILKDDIFPRGYANVTISGEIGWPETPEPVKQAVRILVEAANEPTKYQRTLRGSESLGDYSYSLATEPLTGIREADDLLRPYVNRRIGVR